MVCVSFTHFIKVQLDELFRRRQNRKQRGANGIIAVFVGVIGFGGYFGYRTFVQPLLRDRQALADAETRLANTESKLEESILKLTHAEEMIAERDVTIRDQKKNIEELNARVEKLEIARRLLKVDHRLANIKVLKITEDPKTKKFETRVVLQEVDTKGEPIPGSDPREFTLKGKQIWVDFWLAKFDDQYIEENDLLRSTTLCLFKSIFGEDTNPSDAQSIEKPWVRPQAYAGGSKLSEFEERIWRDFWTIANDSSKSKELGIRANHGQAVYVEAEEGKTYRIQLRASDGLTFKKIEPKTVNEKVNRP